MEQSRYIKFWSNIFFIIPFAFAISYKLWWYALVIGSVFVISSIFHFHQEKKLVLVDVISSTTLMASNFILLFSGHWIMPYSLISVVCAIVALFFYFRQHKHGYNLNHGLWHIFSAAVSFFCVATFLSFMNLF